jgi:uncharacterized MnhB-related membrane protein
VVVSALRGTVDRDTALAAAVVGSAMIPTIIATALYLLHHLLYHIT